MARSSSFVRCRGSSGVVSRGLRLATHAGHFSNSSPSRGVNSPCRKHERTTAIDFTTRPVDAFSMMLDTGVVVSALFVGAGVRKGFAVFGVFALFGVSVCIRPVVTGLKGGASSSSITRTRATFPFFLTAEGPGDSVVEGREITPRERPEAPAAAECPAFDRFFVMPELYRRGRTLALGDSERHRARHRPFVARLAVRGLVQRLEAACGVVRHEERQRRGHEHAGRERGVALGALQEGVVAHGVHAGRLRARVPSVKYLPAVPLVDEFLRRHARTPLAGRPSFLRLPVGEHERHDADEDEHDEERVRYAATRDHVSCS